MAGRNTSPASTSSALSATAAQSETQSVSRATSNTASPPMSTPPTSLGDEASVLSDTMKMESHMETLEDAPATPAPDDGQATPQPTSEAPKSEGRRSLRASRAAVTTYNVQILAGTAIHTPTKYLEKHHQNVLHGSLEDVLKTNTPTPPKKRVPRAPKVEPQDINDPAEAQLATETAQAAQRRKSSRVDLRKEAIRNLAAAGETVAQKGPEFLSSVKSKVQHALRNNFVDSRFAGSGSRSAEDSATDQDAEQEFKKPITKQWERQGLYVGQHRDFDARLKESQNRMRRQAKKVKESAILPLPMFAGERMLNGDYRRDFKLPFDVYNPLPRKVKVDGWVKLQKNRFIGDASALWKRDKQDSSSCYCLPEDGCGEACHNRIMAYECDSTNCRLPPEKCRNRPFAELKRRGKGNGYDYGVEVMETGDKGYGVRAMRTFKPHQIIVEYAGEIITQEECERRMKQVYKKDKCYYLMSFDNKMIIDATRGTIARFVNHSCEPNCEMIKWTVSGEPRMALFAGSRGIMTGEELTYDYNFDPFSSKNIQECRCGTRSCRGVLGPKPKHQPGVAMASSLLAGTKRKIQEVFGSGSGSNSATNSPKKRKLSVMATASLTKTQNALAESSAARAKAEKKASEEAAQRASREHRALRRSTSMSLSSKRSKILRKASRHSMPALKSSRQTTVSLTRRAPQPAPKAGALKPARKPHAISSLLKRNTAALMGKKRISSSKTPVRSPSPESDDSPNITPASLRSASRKLTQSKLPFKPLNLGSSSKASNPLDFPDSDNEDVEEFGSTAKRAKTGPSNANSVRAGVRKTLNKSVKGSKRAVAVARAGASSGFKGMGGLREGGSKSTIRMITGIDG